MLKRRSFQMGIVGGMLVAFLCAAYLFQHRSQIIHKIRSFWGVQTHEIEFFSRNIKLKGTLYTPHRWMSGKAPAIVFCHGGTSIGRKLAIYVIAARQLAERGYVVLTFDFRGFGESDDPPHDSSVANAVSDLDFTQDISAALTYLSGVNYVDPARLFLIGHSFGGGVVLPASVKDERIRKTVSISPPRNTQRLQYAKDALDPMYPTRRLSADMGIDPPIAPEIFYPHLREYTAEEILRYPNHVPLLLIDGSKESVQDRHFLKTVATLLHEPKKYVTIQGADHYYGTRRDQNGAAGDLEYDNAPMTALVSEIDAWLKDDAPLPVVNDVWFFSGHLKIAGTLYLPAYSGKPAPGIVLCHGATRYGRHLALYMILAEQLMQRGYAVLTFDFRGFGQSEHPEDLLFANELDFTQDASAAVTYLSALNAVDASRLTVIGHSFGGGVAISNSVKDSRVQRIISISPPRNTQALVFGPNAVDPMFLSQKLSTEMGVSPPIPPELLYPHEREYTPEEILRYPDHQPILFIDGEKEPARDVAFLRSVVKQVRDPKKYVTIPGADHYFGTRFQQNGGAGDLEYKAEPMTALTNAIDSWLKDETPPTTIRDVVFLSGNLWLTGTLYLPPTTPGTRLPGVVLCHDVTPLGRHLALYELLARALMERGYAVITIDFRGFGDSQTPTRLENFSDLDFAQDVQAALSFFAEQPMIDASRLFAVGHAFGGGVVRQASLEDRRIRRVVVISPLRRVQEQFFAQDAPFPNQPQEQMTAAMRLPELLPKTVLYPHLRDYALEATLQYQTHPPILYVDGSAEDQADLAFLRELLPRIPESKRYVTISDADRYYGTLPDQTYAEGTEFNREVLNRLSDEIDRWLKQEQ
ncbi:dihydrolipoamide S-acetyltransferase [Candidatus Moduliflexus flocculans]|uniref:Dihydrolipoamide S-acetyltransferase n=1 Tax=Candidatus Moduliflexus flocculans TaxID=1499966 RepID=A0A081BPG3_9BACT|nr:dihydrolipoamide S-acetyltransferase [Candidatus Moduliflexus flocculans]